MRLFDLVEWTFLAAPELRQKKAVLWVTFTDQ